MLQQRELMLRFNNQGVPAWENRFLRAGFPLAVRWAHRALGIHPGIEVEDEAVVWQEFDYVAELLSDGRPYLVTDSFGAADLTWAALCASIIVPPIYGVPLPQPDILPPDIAAVINKAREHPAGAFALGLYEKHRRERVGDPVAA
jgi:glutathione S-transferase